MALGSTDNELIAKIKDNISKVIIGKNESINLLVASMICGGHVLIQDVPGVGKTKLAKAFAQSVGLTFKRIQFTPDMLPADLIGTLIYNQKTGGFETRKGPIFSNIILADEINRSPAKVQSALLESMQERQVTIGEDTFLLDNPFLVLATQNPIEQEGTYPLPEAQVDRFMLKLKVSYPSKDEEKLILRKMAKTTILESLTPVTGPEQIINAQKTINDIYVDEKVEEYILNLIFATRDPESFGLDDIKGLIDYGASPRASINIVLASKARAFMEHRGYITPEDVRFVGMDVLRHRVILTYEAEAEELSSEDIIQRLFETIEVP